MKIYDGGSGKDSQLNVFTGNTLPTTTSSTGNQMFISFSRNSNGTFGKGFSASFAFGEKIGNFDFFLYYLTCYFLALVNQAQINLCDNALDLANGQLIVDKNWPDYTYCQWLILAQEDDSYVTIEVATALTLYIPFSFL